MRNPTRKLFDSYVARQAQLNGVSAAAVAAQFSVDPTVQQRLEAAAQQDDAFLKLINVFGVEEQIGQKILIGSKGPLAGVNNSTTKRRQLRANGCVGASAELPAAYQLCDGPSDVARPHHDRL